MTDRKALEAGEGGTGVLGKIRAALEAGVDWVQLREKDLAGKELLALAREAVAAAAAVADSAAASVSRVREASSERGIARLIVNDRLDVALAAGAAGVHLGRQSLGAREVMNWCRSGHAPAEFLVGVSCHCLQEAREAESAGASYIFFGPVFDTPAKRSMGEPQGVARLAEVCRGVHIPVLAIGGVSEENAGECARAGAAGIAAIRMFQGAREAGALKDLAGRLHDLS
ncbi:MAG: thiamine phosphate synthase [Candidatus Acidiferrales bacterium]